MSRIKVLVCYKWVIDEADIKVQAGSHQLNFEKTVYKINEYDRNALEAGTQLAEEQGAEVTALSVGTSQIKGSLKDILSRGPAKALYIADDRLQDLDARLTSQLLKGLVEKSEGYDLIICGEGSSDWYNQQVPSRLGALLGIPSLTCVNKFTVTGQKIVAERKLEDSIEVVEASLPVVLSVLPDLNKPRIPSLKQILGAAKKPSQAYTPEEIGINLTEKTGAFKVKSILGADLTRKQQKIEGDSDQAKASKIVEILGKEGLIG